MRYGSFAHLTDILVYTLVNEIRENPNRETRLIEMFSEYLSMASEHLNREHSYPIPTWVFDNADEEYGSSVYGTFYAWIEFGNLCVWASEDSQGFRNWGVDDIETVKRWAKEENPDDLDEEDATDE